MVEAVEVWNLRPATSTGAILHSNGWYSALRPALKSFDLRSNHFQYFDAINTDIEFFGDGPIFGQVKDFLVQFCSDGFKRFLHRFRDVVNAAKSPAIASVGAIRRLEKKSRSDRA